MGVKQQVLVAVGGGPDTLIFSLFVWSYSWTYNSFIY